MVWHVVALPVARNSTSRTGRFVVRPAIDQISHPSRAPNSAAQSLGGSCLTMHDARVVPAARLFSRPRKFRSTRSRPAAPNWLRKRTILGSIPRVRWPGASHSSGGTSKPVSPCTTDSGIPATRCRHDGLPEAIASRMTVGKISLAPAGIDDRWPGRKFRSVRNRAKISCCDRAPESTTRLLQLQLLDLLEDYRGADRHRRSRNENRNLRRRSSAQASSRISETFELDQPAHTEDSELVR